MQSSLSQALAMLGRKPDDSIHHEVAKRMEKAYPDSKWCDKELQMAQNHDKNLFPVRRIKGQYHRNIDLGLGGILYANFTLDNEDEYKSYLALLIKGIEKK